MLLCRKGIHLDTANVQLCNKCHEDLSCSKLPALSLSNLMWIGDVPQELQDLTLPEQKLIALLNNSLLFKHIHIDHLLIDAFPLNDIPDCLWKTMPFLKDTENSDVERSGYVDNDINSDELCLNGVVPLNMSALIDTNTTTISSNDVRHHLKLRTNITDEITNLNDNIYLVPHEHSPVNEYFNTSFLP
ncbi:unnamed protein product, partial [Rotaria magnacalcarata]